MVPSGDHVGSASRRPVSNAVTCRGLCPSPSATTIRELPRSSNSAYAIRAPSAVNAGPRSFSPGRSVTSRRSPPAPSAVHTSVVKPSEPPPKISV